jgi:hypothetical protein
MTMQEWTTARTPGERLRWAIENQRPEGKRQGIGLLIAKLDHAFGEQKPSGERKFEGTTYPTIRSYLTDSVEAPTSFLKAVAEVLSLSEEWVVLGKGAPTAELGQAAGLADIVGAVNPFHDASPHELGNDLRNQVMVALGLPTVAMAPGSDRPEQVLPAWTTAVGVAWVRFVRSGPGSMDDVRALSGKLAAAIAGPVRSMGIDPELLVKSGSMTEYVFAMIPPLIRLAEVEGIANRKAPRLPLEVPVVTRTSATAPKKSTKPSRRKR